MKWINMGGGHHITREDYDIELLCKSINYFSDKYGVAVYLEPEKQLPPQCRIFDIKRYGYNK